MCPYHHREMQVTKLRYSFSNICCYNNSNNNSNSNSFNSNNITIRTSMLSRNNKLSNSTIILIIIHNFIHPICHMRSPQGLILTPPTTPTTRHCHCRCRNLNRTPPIPSTEHDAFLFVLFFIPIFLYTNCSFFCLLLLLLCRG